MRTRVPSTLSRMSYALCVMFISAYAMADNAPPGVELHTAHYDLYTECPNPPETATILEQFYDQLQKFFGKTPTERLRVKYFLDKDRYVADLKTAKIDVNPPAKGEYSFITHACYVLEQPSIVESRRNLLHECTHQFQASAVTGNSLPPSPYYVEGLAEYWGHHLWDGKNLKAGWYCSVSGANIAWEALARFRSTRAGRLRNIILDGIPGKKVEGGHVDYWEAYAFVTFMIERHPKEFRQLAGWLDDRREPGASWDLSFGKLGSQVDDEYRHWLEVRYALEPLSPRNGAWEQDNGWLEGASNSQEYAVLRLGINRDHFIIDVKPTLAQTDVLLWSHTETRDEMMAFHSGGQIEIRRSAMDPNGNVEKVAKREKQPSQWRMTADRAADHWNVVVDGEAVSLAATNDSDLLLGVMGRAEFRIDSKHQIIRISP